MVYETEIVNCGLCGSSDNEVIWNKEKRKKEDLLNSITIEHEEVMYNGINVQCQHCGLVYVRERMTEKSMTEYYKQNYRNNYELGNVAESMHAKTAIQFFNDCTKEKPVKYLDIGCASGKLVEQMSANGINSRGIDLSEETIKESVAKGFNLVNCTLEDYKENGFDFITILNTLEHMHDPHKALLKIRDMLTDNGRVLITVPYLFTTTIKMSTDAFMSNAHLYTFDLNTLNGYLLKSGLETQRTSIVEEHNMQKIYVYAKKCDPRPVRKIARMISAELIKSRLLAMEIIILTAREHEQRAHAAFKTNS